MAWLATVKKISKHERDRHTHRQRDRQTDRHTHTPHGGIGLACTASHGKNGISVKCHRDVFRTEVFSRFLTFEQYSLSSRQIANCSTLEELQYEKHVRRDGDDCGKRITGFCRPNVRWPGGRELRLVAACQWCETVQDRLALGIPRDRATQYVLWLVFRNRCIGRSMHHCISDLAITQPRQTVCWIHAFVQSIQTD